MPNKIVLLSLLAIIVLISILTGIAVSTYFFLSNIDVHDYAIIFDAGSSGTRTHVYEWNADYKSGSNNELILKEILYCVNDDNGVDKFKNLDEIREKYSKCITKAENVIPESRRNRTKINLVGTAGMRLLEINSANFSKSVLDLVRDYFKTTSFLISKPTQVKILSGIDEAIMAWISANYFEKNFKKIDTTETKGILDLGGASTQIVLVPKILGDVNQYKSIKLFGNDYTTFSQSFLCYGLNEANLMYKVDLLKANNYKEKFMAGCFPKNSKLNLTKSNINKSPCVNGNIYKETLPDEAFQREYFEINGDSNYDDCSQDIDKLFIDKKPCSLNDSVCSFNNAYLANVNHTKFFAISSFWYAIAESNKLWNKNLDGDFDSFSQITKEVCSLNLEELQNLNEKNNASLETWRLVQQCFQNTYTIALLKKYGFNSLENIQTVDQINGFNVGWTTGYLINELNKDDYLPDEELPRKLPLVFYIIIISLLCIIGFGLIGLIGILIKKYSKK